MAKSKVLSLVMLEHIVDRLTIRILFPNQLVVGGMQKWKIIADESCVNPPVRIEIFGDGQYYYYVLEFVAAATEAVAEFRIWHCDKEKKKNTLLFERQVNSRHDLILMKARELYRLAIDNIAKIKVTNIEKEAYYHFLKL